MWAVPPVLAARWRLYRLAVRDEYRRRRDVPLVKFRGRRDYRADRLPNYKQVLDLAEVGLRPPHGAPQSWSGVHVRQSTRGRPSRSPGAGASSTGKRSGTHRIGRLHTRIPGPVAARRNPTQTE